MQDGHHALPRAKPDSAERPHSASQWLISSNIARHRKTCTHSLCGEQERREIEAALHDGDLWAVAATNALELGVDVGSLDVTLHLGFPGTLYIRTLLTVHI